MSDARLDESADPGTAPARVGTETDALAAAKADAVGADAVGAENVGIVLPTIADLPGSYDNTKVPRLPRGKGIRLSMPEILRIVMVGVLLIAVLTLRKPCADSMGVFIEAFEPPADRFETGGAGTGTERGVPAGSAASSDEFPEGEYIHLPTDISEEELKQRLETLRGDEASGAHSERDDDSGGDRKSTSTPGPH